MATLEGHERAAYVQEMFERIARRYVLMNTIMTFGCDRAWRRLLIKEANLPDSGRLLDVATGTGDIALEALAQHPDAEVVGIDFSPAMMQVGKNRPNGDRIQWHEGDALALPFPDDSFDAATSGYLMRNVIDIAGAFREQMRVIKPGGRVLCLDTSPPPNNILKPFILLHLRVVIPLLGRLISGDGAAYTYLPDSTEGFKTPDELAAIMREVGLVDVRYQRLMFGTMALHVGVKPEETR